MATYFISIGKTSEIKNLATLLSKLQGFEEQEQKVIEVYSQSSVLLMGKGVNSMKHKDLEEQFFTGWILDHESSSISLGQSGFMKGLNRISKSELATKEGSFVHAEWNEKSFTIRHDCFGLYPILYFRTKNLFIASDSLLTLSQVREMLSLERKRNNKVHSTRSWTHGLACSIMSTQTILKSVKYLPPASSILVHYSGTSSTYSLTIDEKIPHFPSVFAGSDEPYMAQLHTCMKQIIGSMTAIHSFVETRLKFGLSGGLDSRVILGALQYNQLSLDNVDIRSNTHSSRSNDLQVVEELSKEFGFDFNKEDKSKEISQRSGAKPVRISNMFGNWALASLGLFDMTYMYPSYWDHPAVIEIGGHGAEIVKGTFADMSLFRIAFRKMPYQYMKIRSEIKHGLKSIGIPFNHKNKMQWHYLAYKSAIQNGRSIERTLLAARPLMNRKLCTLGLNHPSEQPNMILEDLLILLNPRLASIPFDLESKNISEDHISLRIEQSSELDLTATIKPYDVFGTIFDIRNGSLDSFSVFGDEFPVKSDQMKQNILVKMEEVWNSSMPPKLQKQYLKAYNLAKKRLNDSGMYAPSAGTPAAKVIHLSLVGNK